MDKSEKQVFIHQQAVAHHIRWSRHALARLACMEFTVAEVEEALQQARIIEEYPFSHRYLPDCLVLMFLRNEPIHCVLALNTDYDYILIVTVYRPKAEEWGDDWQTRR